MSGFSFDDLITTGGISQNWGYFVQIHTK